VANSAKVRKEIGRSVQDVQSYSKRLGQLLWTLLQSGNALGISTHESCATRVDDEKVQKVQTATQAGLELAHTDCEAGTQTFRPMGEELFKLGWIMGAG